MPTATPFPDLSQLSGDLYRQWEKAMGSWWEQVVDNPGFMGGLSQQMGQVAEARKRYEDAVEQSMTQMHLPTRGDMVRLARLCTLLEERLLQQEDLLLRMQDRMEGLEREVLQARLDAAEARLEARDRLEQIQRTLDGADEPPPVTGQEAPKPRGGRRAR